MDTHVGHNSGQPLTTTDDAFAPIKRRAIELEVGLARVPQEIDQDNSGKVTDFVKQCKAAIKDAGDIKSDLKRPHLDANTQIETAYKNIIAPLEKMTKTILDRLNAYEKQRREAEQRRLDEERRKREEAERREREEADRTRKEAEEKARAANSEAELAAAEQAMAEAHDAEQRATLAAKEVQESSKATVSNTKGVASTAVTTSRWDVTNVDMDTVNLNRLRKYFDPETVKRAARAAMRDSMDGKDCTLNIDGITVERVSSLSVR
jgi:hypothetical protein